MVDIWGHGSNGSLINMVYNTYYGMGYNNSTLIELKFWDEFIFYSSSTIAIWVHILIRQNMWIDSHEYGIVQQNTIE
jgi:hypothetical protein